MYVYFIFGLITLVYGLMGFWLYLQLQSRKKRISLITVISDSRKPGEISDLENRGKARKKLGNRLPQFYSQTSHNKRHGKAQKHFS
jgi:hypothetical protein